MAVKQTQLAKCNAFFGFDAGTGNTTGTHNVFLGDFAGNGNTSENNNTFIGYDSDGVAGITNATAIGAEAQVTQSNSLVLGSINGVNSSAADTKVGIGTTAPLGRMQIVTSSATNATNVVAWDERFFVVGGPGNGGAIALGYDRSNSVGYIHSLSPGVLMEITGSSRRRWQSRHRKGTSSNCLTLPVTSTWMAALQLSAGFQGGTCALGARG